MSFESFKSVIKRKLKLAGTSAWWEYVEFENDLDAKKYIARFIDGITITGNSISPKLTVRFGDGHLAMATVK